MSDNRFERRDDHFRFELISFASQCGCRIKINRCGQKGIYAYIYINVCICLYQMQIYRILPIDIRYKQSFSNQINMCTWIKYMYNKIYTKLAYRIFDS